MIVWPFVPADNMTESAAWATDVLRAASAQQRVVLRSVPREAFRFGHAFDDHQAARAQALLWGAGIGPFGVPIWAERTPLDPVAAGAGTLSFATAAAGYVDGGHALLWDDDAHYEAIAIASVTGGGLVLASDVQAAYAAPFVMPLRAGYAPDGLSLVTTDPDIHDASIEFELDGCADLADEGGAPVYRGWPVLMAVPKLAGGLNSSTKRELQTLDNRVGPLFVDTRYAQPDETLSLRWDLATSADLWALRRWLHARKGRARPFWLPSWRQDLTLLEPIGAADGAITVRAIGWAYDVRDIMVFTTSGQAYFRRVLDAAVSVPGEETLVLDAALGASLSIGQVRCISLLRLMCHAADRIEIDHRTGLGAAVDVACELVAEEA